MIGLAITFDAMLLCAVMNMLNLMGRATCLSMRVSYLVLSVGVFCHMLVKIQAGLVGVECPAGYLQELASFLVPLGALGVIVFDRRRAATTCCLHRDKKPEWTQKSE